LEGCGRTAACRSCGSEVESVEVPCHLDLVTEDRGGLFCQRAGVGEAARAQVGEDETPSPGFAGGPASVGGGGVAEGVGLLGVLLRAVSFVDEQVRALRVADDVRAGTGASGVDEGRTALRDTEADGEMPPTCFITTPAGVSASYGSFAASIS
jgi:hypothetical protein